MKFACIILTFILCFLFGKAQDCTLQHQDVIAGDVIDFKPDPITAGDPCFNYTWTVFVDGYNIDLTIDRLNLDSVSGDYLIVSPGGQLAQDDSSIMLTGKITSKKFRIMNNNMFLMLIIQSRSVDTDNLGGFKLSYSRYGEITTAPPTTSPTTRLPTPPSHIDDETIVYAANITAKELAGNLDAFKQEIAKMVDTFCERKNINIITPTPAENVVVEQITSCPTGWPDWSKCTQILLKIPVYLAENNTYEYQLTGAYIREMWDTMANNNLAGLGIQVYKEPNADATMLVWVYIAVGILIIFAGVLIIAWKLDVFSSSNKKASKSQFDLGRVSDTSIKSWISETTYEVPPMMYEENLERSTNKNVPTTTLPMPQDEGPRISGPFTAREYFPTRTIPYDNLGFDLMGEQIPEETKDDIDIDDFSSDEEISMPEPHNIQSNQMHLYEAPREADEGNYSVL